MERKSSEHFPSDEEMKATVKNSFEAAKILTGDVEKPIIDAEKALTNYLKNRYKDDSVIEDQE